MIYGVKVFAEFIVIGLALGWAPLLHSVMIFRDSGFDFSDVAIRNRGP